ncbi:hypothetical protein FB45DRAFT_513323 [Roridomyces roridus]|uniref:Late embryogenesis abundant protein LEA-2 subgroup domain-containing protein n=1 Tax=Roridomyces roridus TaxID=1738132 RepID=A0AAD7BWV9_9AGAR|nr:hypothetical protein FB45DRAFT_513323 [Roridomyces roridus]
MAYQDPYYTAGQYPHSGQQYYGESQYAAPQQYNDAAPGEYNPYTSAQQPHQSYDYGGYRDEPALDQPQPQPQYERFSGPARVPNKSIDETSRFDDGEFTRGPKTAGNLRQYRKDFQGDLWTKGSRGSCVGRFFCCTFMIIVFLVVAILLTLVLWIKPPSVNIGDVAPSAANGGSTQTADGVNINMGVNISVENPNYFAVTFKKIQAEISYPLSGNTTNIGGGTKSDLVISSNAQTNFTFPFEIAYTTSIDPNGKILADLVTKCGILPGTTRQNLVVDYKITLGIQFLFVTISPSVSNSFSFACPLQASDVSGLLGGLLGGTGL